MINFEEEIKKFQPSLEVDEVEDAINNNNTSDLADIFVEMIREAGTAGENTDEML